MKLPRFSLRASSCPPNRSSSHHDTTHVLDLGRLAHLNRLDHARGVAVVLVPAVTFRTALRHTYLLRRLAGKGGGTLNAGASAEIVPRRAWRRQRHPRVGAGGGDKVSCPAHSGRLGVQGRSIQGVRSPSPGCAASLVFQSRLQVREGRWVHGYLL